MKKVLILLFSILMIVTLCGCQTNNSPKQEEITNENYRVTCITENGIEKKMEMDASKTPIIHEANELFYDRQYSASISKILYALTQGEFDPIIYHRLGYLYKNGFGVDKDIDIAIDFYKKGLAYDNLGCVYNLGIYYVEKEDYENARLMFEKGVEIDIALAYYGLGYLYFLGYGFDEPNRDKAIELFEKGVETNDPETIYNIGKFYLIAPNTTEEDHAKGLEISKKAVELGYAEAAFYVADAYETGKGCEVDTKAAFEYYLKGAEMYAYTDYYDNVGYCYEEGVGVEQDYVKAAEYYELATHNGFSMAWYDLGRMYEDGLGVDKDLSKAVTCYMNAAKNPKECPYAEAKLQEILDSINN